MPTHHVPKPDERPDVEVFIDGDWCPGELRMWTQDDHGAWFAQVSTGRRVPTPELSEPFRTRMSARTPPTGRTDGADKLKKPKVPTHADCGPGPVRRTRPSGDRPQGLQVHRLQCWPPDVLRLYAAQGMCCAIAAPNPGLGITRSGSRRWCPV
jgi:hypothetical protein